MNPITTLISLLHFYLTKKNPKTTLISLLHFFLAKMNTETTLIAERIYIKHTT
jgi:hypothetical protein